MPFRLGEFITSLKSSKALNLAILFIIVAAIPLTVFVAQRQQETRQRAQTPDISQNLPQMENNKEKPVSEFLSNEVLVKVKKQAKGQLRESSPQDINSINTGSGSLDNVLKKNKTREFKKIVREESAQQSNDIFSWYKVKIEGESKIIKGNFYKSAEIEGLEDPAVEKVRILAGDLQKDSNVELVQPNYIVKTNMIPNDPYYSSTGSWGQPYDDLWGLKKLQLQSAWDRTQGEGVVVAVVDTGVDYNHPDIAANIWNKSNEVAGNGIDDDNNGYVDDIRGWDFTTCKTFDFNTGSCIETKSQGNDPMDGSGHGTHVAGIIAAVGNNNLGVIGVAPKAKILPVKALNDQGTGFSDWLATAIVYSADNGANVINNSWGCSYGCPKNQVEEDAVRYAINKNVTVVFAAGNSSDLSSFSSPQNMTDPKPIVVAASDYTDKRASFSSFGTNVDVSAPGVDILSAKSSLITLCSPRNAVVGTNYCRLSGTSMATPYVSGVVALIRAYRPNFTPEDVRQVLRASTDEIGDPDFDVYTGAGRVNANKALTVDSTLRVKITNPSYDSIFDSTKPINLAINGTAAGNGFAKYEIFAKQRLSKDNWTLLSSSTTPAENGLLWSGTLNNIIPDIYLIRVVATSVSGYKYQALTEAIVEYPFAKITNSPNAESHIPVISGNKVVWYDFRNSKDTQGDIYLYDLSSKTERIVSDNKSNQIFPSIWGDKIVWMDNRNSPSSISNFDIFLYDLSTNTEKAITNDGGLNRYPKISGNKVVWTKFENNNGNWNWNVYLYDVSTDSKKNITTTPGYHMYPYINGNIIAWQDHVNDSDWDIYIYNIDTGEQRKITTAYSIKGSISISDKKIVWNDNRSGSFDIYLYDINTNTERKISKDISNHYNPIISGNKVVWEDGRNGACSSNFFYNCTVVLYDIASDSEKVILLHPSGNNWGHSPYIDGNNIVWEEASGSTNSYIYMYAISSSSPNPTVTPTPIPTRVSTPTPIIPSSGVGFSNLYPNNSQMTNPVKFSGTIVDNLSTIGYRYVYFYVDGSKVYNSYYYHSSSALQNVPASYTSTNNYGQGSHTWYVKITDLFSNVLATSQKLNFTIGSSTPSPTQSFASPTPIPTGIPTPTRAPTPTPTRPAIPTPTSSAISYPSLTITYPTSYLYIKRGNTITAKVNVSDGTGMKRVDYSFGGGILCSSYSSPFSCTFVVPTSLPPGYGTFKVTAYNNLNLSTLKSLTVILY